MIKWVLDGIILEADECHVWEIKKELVLGTWKASRHAVRRGTRAVQDNGVSRRVRVNGQECRAHNHIRNLSVLTLHHELDRG